MGAPEWTPEGLAKLQRLADVCYDSKLMRELGKDLFPNKSFAYLKVAVDNQVARGTIVRGKPPVSRSERIGRLADLLERSGIDVDDLGSLKQVKVNEWQGFYKDSEGEAHTVDMSGMAVVLNPKWDEGPEWPVVQPARPVTIKPVTVPRPKRKPKLAVILPDTQIHFWHIEGELIPFHDDSAMNVCLQFIKEHQPDLIVNLGDLLDLPTFGKYEQAPTFAYATNEAIARGHQWLAEQRANAPKAQIVVLEGNHDRRLQKYIVGNAGAAFGLRRATIPDKWPRYSIPDLLELEHLNVEYVEGYPAGRFWINDRLVCEHGHRVTSRGSTAKMVADDERVSTVFGHVHRLEMHYKTVQVRNGGRTSFAASPGCLCRIDGAVPSVKGSTDTWGRPVLNYPENWQQGFATVLYEDGDGWFDYQSHYINTFDNYRTSVFGQTYSI